MLIIASLPGLFGGLILPRAWLGLLGFVPIIIGIKELLSREKEEEETVQNVFENRSVLTSWFSQLLSTQTYNFAAITVANGGDNIGIYVPLFAHSNLLGFGITLIVFYILIGVWCRIAYLLTRQPTLAKVLTRYGHAIIPFVLLGLGIFILVENQTYQLLKTVE